MMKHFRKSGGFTLVELVVSIAVASLVTMAATTVLMLALRVNRQTSDTATQQYTVRALLTTMEKAATSGSIQKVTSNLGSWKMWSGEGEEKRLIFSYDAFDQEILANEIVVMEGVYASNAILENGLLSISVETKEGIFETTVYCRGGNIDEEGTTPTIPSEPTSAVDTFLAKLLGEINSSGVIKNGDHAGRYYSEWYIGGYDKNPAWNAETPWCACFVSWALVEAGQPYPRVVNNQTVEWYSHVNEFEQHFKMSIDNSKWVSGEMKPAAGNLVFFNFDDDEESDHIGVVYGLSNDEQGRDIIITIEGNSAGHVAVRSYRLDDPRILGYGRLAGLGTE
jgi:prepilin-type N-terminal cleavage/methylation domain-containing protein